MLITPLLLGPLGGCLDYSFNLGQGVSGGGSDSETSSETLDLDDLPEPEHCDPVGWPPEEVGLGDQCTLEGPPGGFTPVVEWSYLGDHLAWWNGCLSLPVVGDLDGDGKPEVVVNVTDMMAGPGQLVVLDGDGGAVKWSEPAAQLGYATSPALADLDGDGFGEVITVKEHETSMWLGAGDYTILVYDAWGNQVWESEHFLGADFGYATGPVVSDMDHDGSPEIIAGRVILAADGTTRAVGQHGSGSQFSDGALPAVSDLDLDGIEEVITGNTLYGPDGQVLWSDLSHDDGYVSVANLDDDAQGEWIVVADDSIRVHDTNGALLWGPMTFQATSTLSIATVADLDVDGRPEIAFAGSNKLYVLNHDGTLLWSARVTDETGATGGSVFDFEGDGYPELVYVDEVEILAFDGATGAKKFETNDHSSNTMYDYPVIADVDADGQAEILVCHNIYSSILSVYGDRDGGWAPAREVWNQHAYSISNINDDLSVPATATPSFLDSNTFHSAVSITGQGLSTDLEAEIIEVCTEDCEAGVVPVTVRVLNRGAEEIPAGVPVALYAELGGVRELVAVASTDEVIPTGWASAAFELRVDPALLQGSEALWLVVDDDGTGTGGLEECSEANNDFVFGGPVCDG